MIGIPRSLFYYDFGIMWKYFFEYLKIPYQISPNTNEEIKELGNLCGVDEMCLSMKHYLGHVLYLSDKVDYILVPRVDNYGIIHQTCTNFLAAYDIVKNIVDVPILNYNINLQKKETEEEGMLKLGKFFGYQKSILKKAYHYAKEKEQEYLKQKQRKEFRKIHSSKLKILVLSHNYVLEDTLIGKPIQTFFQKNGVELIDANFLDGDYTSYSKDLYWSVSQKLVGALSHLSSFDGVLFLSAFPCGLDSLVNELVIRKLKKPYLNLVLDDLSSLFGIETRVESFLDILSAKKN